MDPPESAGANKARPKPRTGDKKPRRLALELDGRRRRDIWLRSLEIALWLSVGVGVFLFRYWKTVAVYGKFTSAEILPEAFLSLLIVLIPIVFQLVFQVLPLERVRLLFDRRGSAFEYFAATQVRATHDRVGSPGEAAPARHNSLSLLQQMADESDSIAEKIYTRAGVYLLFGVMIAFSGLGFFYMETRLAGAMPSPAVLQGKANEEAAQILSHRAERTPLEAVASMMSPLLGRMGVLFFIELVAFFFLRQYRAAMDEYRYFEAIKRRREENLATATLLFQSAGDKIDFFAFIGKCSLYSDLPRLAPGESTEILETRKLTKDEAALFEKMIDAIAKGRAS